MKYGVVVLLIAVFALGGALYAAAAPQKRGPTNTQLAAQITSLRNQVTVLKADVSYLSGRVKSLDDCQLGSLWRSAQATFGFVYDLYSEHRGWPLESLALFYPKRPECS